MIERKLDAAGNRPYYVCTLCGWAYSGLHEANKHALSCGFKEPQQFVFQSISRKPQVKNDRPI